MRYILLLILRLPRFFLHLFSRIELFLQLKAYNVIYGEYPSIFGRVMIRNDGKIKIGKNFSAYSGPMYNPIGGDTLLRFICRQGAELLIGDNVGISNSTLFCTKRIVIEDNVMIGGGCRVWDTDFHSIFPEYRLVESSDPNKFVHIKCAGIHIKKNAFIGGGSIILKGVTVGENAVIAAGSVVTSAIPDNEIWGGNPAKKIKDLKTV